MAIISSPTRRVFIQGMVPVIAAGALRSESPEFEYVGTSNSIQVLRSVNGRKTIVQSVPSQNPSFLALDATRQFLFAVNEISEYQGLPCGSVESYAIHLPSGHLNLIGRQALALSATMPRSLAIAPDGRHLVVAVYGGGAYNVLPVYSNGELGGVSQALKEIGSGFHPEKQATAHPHSVVFHPSGRFLIATDTGSDCINVFSFAAGSLTRLIRAKAPAGSGPAQVAINANGSLIYVQHRFTALVSCYRFNPAIATLTHLANRNS